MSLKTFYQRKKYWIKDYFNGSPMWKDFCLVSSIIKNPQKFAEKRNEMLYDILSYAKENVPFYGNIKGDRLSNFPVVNKQTILANYQDFLVDRKNIPGQIGEVHLQKTSGSTGTPFEIHQDTKCRNRRIATIKAANELIGFHSFDALMHLRAVKHYWGFPDDLTYKPELNILYADNANFTPVKIEKILEAINKYKIKFVRGYVTAIDVLTSYAVDHHIELVTRPTFISGGELLLEPLRRRIVERLNCHVISQYANEENGLLGQSTIDGDGSSIQLYLANCYIEVLKMNSDEPVNDNELGRIVVTDYTNRAMPFIRYEIGDLAKVGNRSVSGEITSLKELCGRKTDLIMRTDGSFVDMFNSISPEIYNNPSVKQWQFIQKNEKRYQLILCAADDSLVDLTEHFEKLMKDVLGSDAEIEIKYVKEIPVLLSGKRKVVIQEYKK